MNRLERQVAVCLEGLCGGHASGGDRVRLEAKAETAKPSLILCRTRIAYGSPNKEGSCEAHGAPLGPEEVRLTKSCLGCLPDAEFCIPEKVLPKFRACVERGAKAQSNWQTKFESWGKQNKALAAEWRRVMAGGLPEGWGAGIPDFSGGKPIATRAASGQVLNAIAGRLPELIGGSADLAPSNNTLIKSAHDFQKSSYDGRNLRFGVREHAMGAILSGMALHKGLRPYGGTFLVFADYMRPAIRLAALMQLPVIYVFTHDSIAVGEDGPTHQPVEHLASLRAIPGLRVIRPADATETVAAWKLAIASAGGPVALILSRQNLPVLEKARAVADDGPARGGYVLAGDGETPQLILIATGSEVQLALQARAILAAKGVAARVVSLPCWELFEAQPKGYRDAVLPPAVTARLAVEAGIAMGWERYTGLGGEFVGMRGFGASAPGAVVMEKFGFTADHIAARALTLLGRK